MQAITLLIVLENRLPAGEREEVFAAVAETAWRPMLKSLHRAGNIRFALRLGGPVLDWLESNDPDYISMLQEMIGRGQVEILSGLHDDAARLLGAEGALDFDALLLGLAAHCLLLEHGCVTTRRQP